MNAQTPETPETPQTPEHPATPELTERVRANIARAAIADKLRDRLGSLPDRPPVDPRLIELLGELPESGEK